MTGVTIGDVHLNWKTLPGGTRDEFGVDWGLTALDGWFDGWEGSGVVEQRTQADGAWISPQYASGRVIHVGGTIEAGTWDGVTQAWDRLLAQIPFRPLGTIRVSTGEGAVPEQTALVQQHEKPLLPVEKRFGGRAEFSLSLFAPDSRKYDVTSRSASLVLPISSGGLSFPITFPISFPVSTSRSQVTLVNDGNVTTYPTLVLTGPCPPARIANLTTGELMRVVDAVPADQSLVIDVLNSSATNGGQFRSVLGSWWGLAPGANEVSFWADGYDAAAQLSISYRSAWK